jgi:hypothetical protein
MQVKALISAALAALVFVLGLPVAAQELFYRAHGQNSVKVGPICIPELVGEEYFSTDFDTPASFNITIVAHGDAASQVFEYTGGNIDDGPNDPDVWGNPTTNAIEVDDLLSAGSATGCILLSIRDEVFDVPGVTEWAIVFSDAGGSTIDQTAKIIALASTTDLTTAMQSAANAALVALGLDHMFSVAIVGTDCADNAYCAKLVSKSATADFDTFDNQTDSAEALRDFAGLSIETPLQALTGMVVAVQGVVGSATPTTIVSDAHLDAPSTQSYVGMTLYWPAGFQVARVTAFDPDEDEITFEPALSAAPSVSDPFFLLVDPASVRIGSVVNDAIAAAALAADVRTELVGTPAGASVSADLAAAKAVLDLLQQGSIAATVQACDTGSETTCVDSARSESAPDHWKGQALVPLTGTNAFLRRCVVDFTGNTLTVKPAFPAAITTNTYLLVQDASCNGVLP